MSDKKKVVVLGGGIGSLSVGYFLTKTGKYEITVLEASPAAGGLCASFKHNGFILDYGPHKIYSVIPGVLDDINALMGDELIRLVKKNRIYLKGHLLDYPLKLGNLASVLGLMAMLRLGAGYAIALIKSFFSKRSASSYRDYMIARFGGYGYRLIFEPLANKVWGEPSELHADMGRMRVPAQGGFDVLLRLLGIKKETEKTNANYFLYPRGGFAGLPEAFKNGIEANGGKVIVGVKITELARTNSNIKAVNYEVENENILTSCDYVISTIPMPELWRLLFGSKDEASANAIQSLRLRHLVLVYIFINRSMVLQDQWVFFPEKKYIFSRVSEQKQMDPALGPGNSSALCCDFTCDENDAKWKVSDDGFAKACIDDLVSCGFIEHKDVLGYLVKRKHDLYPRYGARYKENLDIVIDKFKTINNLVLTGRVGMYNYNNADHCIDMGRFIADKMIQGDSSACIMDALRNRVKDYRIVD